MISGKLTPIPQNSITETTVWHKKFFHIPHIFHITVLSNKMRLVPIFTWGKIACVSFFHLPCCKMVIMEKLTPTSQNNRTKATAWHKSFLHL